MTLQLDMYQSAGVGVAALLLGMLFTRHIPFLKRFCIPAPVSGGLLISLLTLLLYALGVECSFDGTVKDLCMMLFFTSVGFQSDMKALRQGGKPLLVMIGLVAALIAAQNLISVGIARGLGLSPLFGMSAGSIPMSGGHGTSGGFSPLLEELGLPGASSITMAAATFGLERFDGLQARGNFYKCGDGLPVPHFVSWAPIDTPNPDFHRPEFFDTICFV